MKDNKLVKFATFVLLITIVAVILVSGTYARYTSTAEGKDTATVAKWSFEVDGVDIKGTTKKTVTFNIFDTITNVDDSTETAVKETDGTLIAPGTKGSFEMEVENKSEVKAEYKVDYTITNTSNVPLKFSKDGTNWYSTLADVNQDWTTVNIGAAKSKTVKIYWKWDFETGADDTEKATNNAADTTLGIAATAPTVEVTATITARQVD